MIISLMDEANPVLKSFKIDGDKAEQEDLVIE
jgi:hypothetical protein